MTLDISEYHTWLEVAEFARRVIGQDGIDMSTINYRGSTNESSNTNNFAGDKKGTDGFTIVSHQALCVVWQQISAPKEK